MTFLVTRCSLCGKRLGRDESELMHEFSGRCLAHDPPPKPKKNTDPKPKAERKPRAPRKRAAKPGTVSRAEWLEQTRAPHGTKVRSRRCGLGADGGPCEPCRAARGWDAPSKEQESA